MAKKKRPDLLPGHIYRVTWPDHYRPHQRDVGYLGEFLRWERATCQLHGEFLGWRAVFATIKAAGARGGMFSADLHSTLIRADAECAAPTNRPAACEGGGDGG